MSVTAPDFTKAPPRSGRDMLGRYAWLARLADKVRAEHAGTQEDYVAYCPLSMGFLHAAGVTRSDVDRLIREGASDDALVRWFDEHVSDERREKANRFVLEEHASSLDQQDAEEGRA
ncbi:MAG TPA: DUF5069 domain-containing protein [Candidatus Baltobacteraceae bacterium]|nr:DUF5069 domain-containing protein [Candidatus Baltobacteraceae bacterium]